MSHVQNITITEHKIRDSRLPGSMILFLAFTLLSFFFICEIQTETFPFQTAYREDCNMDGTVDIHDVIYLIYKACENQYYIRGDFDGNAKCEITDVLQLLLNISLGKRTPLQSSLSRIEPVPSSLSGPLAVSERWPECTDLVGWVKDVFRLDGVEQASETRKGISFYTWLRLFSRNCYGGMPQAYEGNPGNEDYVTDPHKNLFIYGWGYCDTHSRIAEALWRELNQDSTSAYRVCVRNPTGGYHTMIRLRLDGSFGAFDILYGYYLLDRDSPEAKVLDWAEVGVDSNVTSNKTFENKCKPFLEMPGWYDDILLRYEPVFWKYESEWEAAGRPVNQVFNSPMHVLGTPYHDMNWQLPRGTTLTRFWSSNSGKWYIPLNRESDFLTSGRFYRLADISYNGYWAENDPNFKLAEPYIETVPIGQGYPEWLEGCKSIGQAWGKIVYEPDMAEGQYIDAIADGSNIAHRLTEPYLVPYETGKTAQAVFDFYCPYILIDGTFSGGLVSGENDEIRLEIRTLAPKPRRENQEDVWSEWAGIASDAGQFEKILGSTEYAAGKVTLYGKYRFQLRLTIQASSTTDAIGLSSLRCELNFENGIMTLPQLLPGENTVFFKVQDSKYLRGPVQLTYVYETEDGTELNTTKLLVKSDFRENKAFYTLNLPELRRCNRIQIKY